MWRSRYEELSQSVNSTPSRKADASKKRSREDMTPSPKPLRSLSSNAIAFDEENGQIMLDDDLGDKHNPNDLSLEVIPSSEPKRRKTGDDIMYKLRLLLNFTKF